MNNVRKTSLNLFVGAICRHCDMSSGHSIFFDYEDIGYFRYEAVLTWFSDYNMVYIQDIDGKELYGCCFESNSDVREIVDEFLRFHGLKSSWDTYVYVDADDYKKYGY